MPGARASKLSDALAGGGDARIFVLSGQGGGRHRIRSFPVQERAHGRIEGQQPREQCGAGAWQPQDEDWTLDSLIDDFRVPLAVIDDAQAMDQQLGQLAAREVAAEQVQPRVGLERLD